MDGVILLPNATIRFKCAWATAFWVLPARATFYTTLLEPDKTFAQAARAARQSVRAAVPNNPIWLAYSIYAHPNARLHLD